MAFKACSEEVIEIAKDTKKKTEVHFHPACTIGTKMDFRMWRDFEVLLF
jgi:hypothetical protein